jgi:hypothetical protein
VATAADWKTETAADGEVLHLNVPRPQEANPRAPVQYALLETEPLACFTLDVEVKSDIESVSLIVVYAWKDPLHFNYVHLSTDAARQQPVHNGVFHVYGGDRVRISNDEGPCALAHPTAWTHVRIVYDSPKHLVETWINGEINPSCGLRISAWAPVPSVWGPSSTREAFANSLCGLAPAGHSERHDCPVTLKVS